ncbi:MAG: aminotransferase class V-fold PLP-dependent enzyme [Hyphomonadaceae bacterium]|nr:aminotransferase class V-fold PLP-dependent enzyme [Hyphomonadaceae bacterium]
MKSYKHLFTRAFAAAPSRLHLAAHSHHLWPDASRDAQLAAWDDAAALADRKWAKVFGEILPQAQANVARELNLPSPDTVVFAPNTHELIVRLFSALSMRPVRILTSDCEFHSFARQSARWAEAGLATLEIVPTEPFADFETRFLEAAATGAHDLVFVSHLFFKTGRAFARAFELARIAKPEGPWVVIDGYHAFMALPTDLAAVSERIFYVGGGYKYAMTGEGAAFLHAPPGYGARPVVTGWYAAFGALETGARGVAYANDARRFLGATFDPSALYRLNAVCALLRREGLATGDIAKRAQALRAMLHEAVAAGKCGALRDAEVLNADAPARFTAFRHPRAGEWKAALDAADVIVDCRDDVLRIGFGLYHDPADIERFCALAARALR